MDFDRAKVPENADDLVERALFLAATGYWYTEVRRESTEKTGVKVTRIRKQAAPSTTAAALWLSRRRPECWGDAAAKAEENNLLALIRSELEGGDDHDLPDPQPEAAADHDLVVPDTHPQP